MANLLRLKPTLAHMAKRIGKTAAFLGIVLGLCITFASPIYIAREIAYRQGLNSEERHVLSIAKDITQRADETSDQVQAALKKLTKEKDHAPCSKSSIAVMRQLDVSSSYLQALGYIADDKLICSSLGQHDLGIPVGAPQITTSTGMHIRTEVYLPFAPGMPFVIIEKDGYAAIIHRDLIIDVLPENENMSVGLFDSVTGIPVLKRGSFNPNWKNMLGNAQQAQFFDGSFMVSLLGSQHLGLTAFAAAPPTYLDKRMQEFTIVMVPIGVIFGGIFAGLFAYFVKRQLSLPTLMRAALKRNEFYLLYQPLVDLRTRECIGAEALMRWRRPNGSIICPDVFIPIAENSGLIQDLTRKMMEVVRRDLPELLRRHPDVHIAMNFSTEDLESADIVKRLREFIQESNISTRSIVVEATERGFLRPEVAQNTVSQIRATGIQVAIDDFGTGYSSLSYLTSFKVDYLKIDKSFVDTIDKSTVTSNVALHIIRLAKSLRLATIAEGVETEAQARFLNSHGVDYAQGWLFGHPVELEQLSQLLQSTKLLQSHA